MDNKPNTTCKVCGKKYFCCADRRKINSWKTMCCSQECYKEYMIRIEKSRAKVEKVKNINAETINIADAKTAESEVEETTKTSLKTKAKVSRKSTDETVQTKNE